MGTTFALVLLSQILIGCGEKSGTERPVPVPVMDGVEPQVVARIHELADRVREQQDRASWLDYARTLHIHDTHSEAMIAYEQVVAKSEGRDRFEPLYLMGIVRLNSDREAAIQTFRRAIEVRNDDVPCLVRLGSALEELGRDDEALTAYRTAAEATSESSFVELGLGRIALRAGNHDTARRHLRRALRLNPDHREARAALAQALAASGHSAEARRERAKTGDIQTETSMPDALMYKVLEAGVSFQALDRLAIRSFQVGDLNQALIYIDRALAIRPDAMKSLHRRGVYLAQLGRFAEAVAPLRRVVDNEPKNADARNMLGSSLFKLKKPFEAKRFLEEALALRPSHRETLYNLAVVMRGIDRKESLRLLTRLRRKHPKHQGGLYLRGVFYVEANKKQQAINAFEELLVVNPRHEAGRRALAQLLTR